MTYVDLEEVRRASKLKKFLHKQIKISDIEKIDQESMIVNNSEIKISKSALANLDKALGISKSQAKLINDASGEFEFSRFRNYMSANHSVEDSKRLVLVANSKVKEVQNIIPVVKEYIPLETFFDFVEMFANEFDCKIQKYESADSASPEVSIYLEAHRPLYKTIGENDDFITNGLFLSWKPTEVNIGHYFIRLVCINGLTRISKNKKMSNIYTLSHNNMYELLQEAKNKNLINDGFHEFRDKAKIAQKITSFN